MSSIRIAGLFFGAVLASASAGQALVIHYDGSGDWLEVPYVDDDGSILETCDAFNEVYFFCTPPADEGSSFGYRLTLAEGTIPTLANLEIDLEYTGAGPEDGRYRISDASGVLFDGYWGNWSGPFVPQPDWLIYTSPGTTFSSAMFRFDADGELADWRISLDAGDEGSYFLSSPDRTVSRNGPDVDTLFEFRLVGTPAWKIDGPVPVIPRVALPAGLPLLLGGAAALGLVRFARPGSPTR